MKKYFVFVLVALVLFGSVTPAAAQTEATPTPLEYVDAQVAVFEPYLQQYQYDYYVANGFYFQALQSHSVAPDGADVADQLDAHPTDQTQALAVLWNYAGLPASTNFSFRVDTYSSGDGDGYVLTVETVIDGETWKRSTNYGPASEDWRSNNWYKVFIGVR